MATQCRCTKVLQEGGRLLYESYIHRKSFGFAADAFCEVLTGEMKLRFVRHDTGEARLDHSKPGVPADSLRPKSTEGGMSTPRGALEVAPRPGSAPAASSVDARTDVDAEQSSSQVDGWALEAEPARCRIDTWARACVPIRKVGRKSEESRKGRGQVWRSGSRASIGSVSGPGSRPTSRFGPQTVSEEVEAPKALTTRGQLIPLVDEREEDEEEAMLRDLKEREARKMRDEQVRTERKAAEIEEAARLAQIKDDKKQFTYDADGNVIWVQPPQVHRLPNTNPVPSFVCKQEEVSQQDQKAQPEKKAARRDKHTKSKRENSVDFKDGFKKFLSQQPSMMEAMVMSPGVQLEERNRTKKGEKVKSNKPATMSRKEYEEISQGAAPPRSEEGGASKAAPGKVQAALKGSSGGVTALPAVDEASRPAEMSLPRQNQGPDAEPSKVVRSEVGSDLVKASRDAVRPLQPAPPTTSKRVQTKRDALGFSLSTRERMHIDAGSRFPGCAAQPPLGATMGHGLAPSAQKYQDYFFPSASGDVGEQATGESEQILPAENAEGQIVSKNPQLKHRLFGTR
ncbi:DCP5 [Symbiodinium natans]|uniref:DCP5 protein n=1 Tax=Symbiodinium natans TaxID=878477 RepID=A0A812PLL3_9DINO|nr:DCP5 [Symbiodinium natans]